MRMTRRLMLAASLLFLSPLAGAAPSREGIPAPEFTVRSLDNRDLRLASLRHHGPVIVEFWATWCDSCGVALTELETWRKQYGARGLEIVAFSVDGTRNTSLVRPYVLRQHIHYPVAMDGDQRIQRSYQANEIPTSFLVDRAGNIVAIRSGWRRGDTRFSARIAEQFAADSATAGSRR
jgi:peroxiredoxin